MSDKLHVEIWEALNLELHIAVQELAKSVEIAVTRINLRAECDAAISAAENADSASETLRSVASEIELVDQAVISLVPETEAREANGLTLENIEKSDFRGPNPNGSGIVAPGEVREESKIAMRITEIQERLKEPK